MRILLLTQWFEPEPAFKGLAFARELMARGHEVAVLTGFPNYPAGRLYPGYRVRAWQRESMEGVTVVRVPLYPSHDASLLRRAWNYVSFALSATLLGPFLLRRPDVIYAYHPPGTVGLPALALKRWFGSPLVYDVQDLWPDTIPATGMITSSRLVRLLDIFCRYVYRRADRVVVLSEGFRRTLIKRGVAADRVSVIYNWAPEHTAWQAADQLDRDKFTVVFAGNIGLAQGLDAVLDAAALCTKRAPEVQFKLVGSGVELPKLKARASRMGLANLEFVDWQPPATVEAILRKADALLVHLKDDPLFAITIPSKTQAYLAAGRPMVMAVRGDAADLVMRSGAGVLAEPDNPESIVAAILHLKQMPREDRERMGSSGRHFYQRELAIDRAVEKFDVLFRDAVTQAKTRESSRVFNCALALAALVMFWPIMLAVALVVRLGLGSPVLFRQVRIGKRGRPFEIYKFRTMRDVCAEDGSPQADQERLTPLGQFLRSTSLDELPELWNVLRGEMNLVGPRPLLPQYLPRYTERQKRRHEVRPGITGWAQIHGRNAISWNQKFELDVWYVDHRSLVLDVRILLRTVVRIFQRHGIHSAGCSTMPEFLGTENG